MDQLTTGLFVLFITHGRADVGCSDGEVGNLCILLGLADPNNDSM
jgi:hypothetical protein